MESAKACFQSPVCAKPKMKGPRLARVDRLALDLQEGIIPFKAFEDGHASVPDAIGNPHLLARAGAQHPSQVVALIAPKA